jgi:uncharacterized membrane protein
VKTLDFHLSAKHATLCVILMVTFNINDAKWRRNMTTKTKSASALIAAGAMAAALAMASAPAVAEGEMEHCFGVAKAGSNDCKSSVPGSTCQGSSKVDADGKSYINVPVGTCDKIVGGSLTPEEA